MLSGWKTYIGGVILMAIGGAKAVGIDIPGFENQDAGTLVSTGLMFIFTRLGIAKIG